MSIIEGIGDEVTVVAILFLVLILVATIIFTNRTILPSISEPTASEPPNEPTQQNSDDIVQEEIQVLNHESETQNDDKESPSETPPTVDNDHQNLNVPSAPDISEVDEDNHENPTIPPGQIHVRLKYLDDTDRTVTSYITERIADFKRINFPEEITNNKIVRLIYNGQLLNDNYSIGSYGIHDSCVVHVHISQRRTPQEAETASQNADLDISHLLWPLLSVILGIFWMLYFKYPEFFSMMSVGILVLFTGSFIYFYGVVQR